MYIYRNVPADGRGGGAQTHPKRPRCPLQNFFVKAVHDPSSDGSSIEICIEGLGLGWLYFSFFAVWGVGSGVGGWGAGFRR